jgi:hypothetical protein
MYPTDYGQELHENGGAQKDQIQNQGLRYMLSNILITFCTNIYNCTFVLNDKINTSFFSGDNDILRS